jgi:hypothetical protein
MQDWLYKYWHWRKSRLHRYVLWMGCADSYTIVIHVSRLNWIGSCSCNNGGCPTNALCSYDKVTNAVKCDCKKGFVNTGSATKLVCTGKHAD